MYSYPLLESIFSIIIAETRTKLHSYQAGKPGFVNLWHPVLSVCIDTTGHLNSDHIWYAPNTRSSSASTTHETGGNTTACYRSNPNSIQ